MPAVLSSQTIKSVRPGMTPENDPSLPSFESPEYKRQKPRWSKMRDVAAGETDRIQANADYLPRWPAEAPEDYALRRKMTEFLDATGRTIRAMVGLVFQRDPQLGEDTPDEIAGDSGDDGAMSDATGSSTTTDESDPAAPPPSATTPSGAMPREKAPAKVVKRLPPVRVKGRIEGDWENIDGRGTHGDVFAQRVLADGIEAGLNGVLVDFPPAPAGLTALAESEMNLRPFWCLYRAEDIISARFQMRGALSILTQLVLREQVDEPLDEFGVQCATYFLVYRRGTFVAFENDIVGGTPQSVHEDAVTVERWQQVDVHVGGTVTAASQKQFVLVAPRQLVRNAKAIPFSIGYYGTKLGALEARPPLLGLAEKNLAHYKLDADLRYILHKTCVPLLAIVGADPDTQEGKLINLGPNLGIYVPKEGDVKWVELAGTGIAPSRETIKEVKEDMASLGLAFLVGEKRAAETAEAKRIDSGAQNATLASCVRTLEDQLESSLGFHGQFLNIEEAGSIEINREFDDIALDPTMLDTLSAMEAKGQLSLETLWDLMSQWHLLPSGFNRERERMRIMRGATSLGLTPPTPTMLVKAGALPPGAPPNTATVAPPAAGSAPPQQAAA